jgi:anti-sigma B factor antagonist
MLTHHPGTRDRWAARPVPYTVRTRMADPASEHSSVDAHGIRPPDAYAIEVRDPSGAVLVLGLEGEFDLAAAPTLREQLEAARGTDVRGVVLDLAAVTFVDSSGLRELLRASSAYREAGMSLVLAALPPTVVRLFELTRATDAIAVAPTVESAVERAAPA